MFSLHEQVVYPGHGVAKISRVITKKVGTTNVQFFELTFVHKQMTILVPVDTAPEVGIRKLCSREGISELFEFLAEPVDHKYTEMPTTNWNKRSKEYQVKIRTGDLREICRIYRGLKHIEGQKELSFGEKNLLQKTEGLLAEEIAVVNQLGHDHAMEQLRSLVAGLPTRGNAALEKSA